MDPAAVEEMARVEERHWWFRARRAMTGPLVSRALAAGNGPVLDLGCGTGAHLRRLPADVVGVGLDGDAACLAHSREGGAARLVRGEGGAVPLADASVGLVTAYDVLEHFDDDEGAMAEIHRVLRPGGFLLATVPCHMWLWGPHDEVLHHRRRYAGSELEGKLRAAGFTVEQRRGFNFLLLPVLVVVRTLRRLLRLRAGSTDFFALPPGGDALVAALLAPERWLQALCPLPIGASRIILARRG